MIDAIVTETDALKSSRSDQSPFQPAKTMNLHFAHLNGGAPQTKTLGKLIRA